jgi:hypothetical protein
LEDQTIAKVAACQAGLSYDVFIADEAEEEYLSNLKERDDSITFKFVCNHLKVPYLKRL